MNVKYLVVHCSDTPNNREVTAAEIHGWHKNGNGWDGIGYHVVIRRDGMIEYGRPDYWAGAHVKDYNSKSLGVCLIGRDQFTGHQMETLRTVLRGWKMKHPFAETVGHRDLDQAKTCPNFDVSHWLSTGEVKA